MTVTLEQIAKKAKVSITTVSKVINNQASDVGIKLETQKRVLEIAKELDYQPHSPARSLRLRRSNTLGVVACDMREPYYGDILTGVEEEAKNKGYFCMLSTVKEDLEREQAYLQMFRQKRVDGIIIIGAPLELKYESIQHLAHEKIPVVFVGKKIENLSVPYVAVDNRKGGFLATEYLIGLGHCRIAFIKGAIEGTETVESKERLEGYRLALQKYNLPYDEAMVKKGRVGRAALDSGYRCCTEMISKPAPPTAIFAFDDLMAIGAMKAIRDKELKVPADISVVGFDNILLAGYSDPPLTTIEQPMEEMGKKGAEILIALIGNSNKESKEGIEYTNCILQPQLIIRESTSPIRKQRDKNVS